MLLRPVLFTFKLKDDKLSVPIRRTAVKKLFAVALALALLSALAPLSASDADTIILEEPADGTVAYGGALTLRCVAETEVEMAYVKYQWYKANTTASYGGAPVGDELSTGELAVSTRAVGQAFYYCAVNEYLDGTLVSTVNSRIATVNVALNAPVITVQPTAVSAETGETAVLTCSAVSGNTGLSSTLSYRWFVSDTQNGTFTAFASGPSCAPDTAAPSTRYYRCMVTETAGGLNEYVSSSTVSVTVITPTSPPVITAQPHSVWDAVGAGTRQLSVTATGEGLSYQWYFVGASGNATALTNGTSSGITYSGASSSALSLTYPNADMTLNYRCAVSNAGGTVTSNTVTVKVKLQDPAAAPVISRNPGPVEVFLDEELTLSVAASSPDGGTLSYQWYSNTQSTVYSGIPVNGATKETFTVPTDEIGNTYYYCLVTNTLAGDPAHTYSHVALVSVMAPATPSPTLSPTPTLSPSPTLVPAETPAPTEAPTPSPVLAPTALPSATVKPSDDEGVRFPWWIIPVAFIALAAGGVSAWLLARDKRRWGVTDEDETEAEPRPAPVRREAERRAPRAEKPAPRAESPAPRAEKPEKKVEFIDLFSDDDDDERRP